MVKKLLSSLVLAGALAGCGPDIVSNVEVKGTTQRYIYKTHDQVKLKGPGDLTQRSFALQETPNFEIRTKSRTFTPTEFISPELSKQLQITDQDRMHVILQYEGNLTNSEREELKKKGIELSHPVSSKTYMAEIPTNANLETLLNTEKRNIRFVGEIRPEDKLDPLWNRRPTDNKMKGFNVMFHPDVSPEEAKDILENTGAEIVHSLNNSFAVTGDDNQQLANTIANLDEVYLVGQAIPLTELNHNAAKTSNVTFLRNNTNLTGHGSVNLVYDSGCGDHDHPDVNGRTILGDCLKYGQYYPAGHATHVNTTVGGNGIDTINHLGETCTSTYIGPSFEAICELYNNTETKESFDRLFSGMAPETITIVEGHGGCDKWCIIENPQQMELKFNNAVKRNAVSGGASLGPNVRSNGFPCELYGMYDSVATMMDFLIRGENGEGTIAVTWSAGNERYRSEWDRRCFREEFPKGEEYFTMSGGPASSKNVLTVGAAQFEDGCTYMIDENEQVVPDPETCKLVVSTYTSFGPLEDGNRRVKPTVINFGGGINEGMISGSVGGGYTAMAGTSMSRPATDGVNALLAEQYRETLNTTDKPSPQLLYAVMINTADDETMSDNRYVDFKTGFGMVNAKEAAELIANQGFAEDKVSETGEVHTHFFEVNDDKNVEVTLAYLDYPGKFIINDLDATLKSPSGVEYKPHILNAFDPTAEAKRKRDSYNNIEKITIDLPEEKEQGTWELQVKALDLVVGPQHYAVAFSHTPFKPETASATLGKYEVPVQGNMGFTIERELYNNQNCIQEKVANSSACSWERIDQMRGPTFDLEAGETYYFNNDFPEFRPDTTGTYRIKASFQDGGTTHHNRNNKPAEKEMYFLVKEE